MDLSEAVFTSVDAIRSADTGSGGLAAASGTLTAIVNRMVQRDDPNYDETRAEYWPLIVVDVIEKNDTVWGLTGAPDQAGFVLRMTVHTLRDPGRAIQNAVSARMLLKYDGATLASQTGWVFGPLSVDRRYQLRARPNALVMVHEYSGRAGDVVATLTGRQGSVTFSGSEGAGITAGTMIGQTIDEDITISVANVERFGDQGERVTRQDFSGTITASFTYSSMTPVIPVGTQGVLVVFDDTAGVKKITYTNAVVIRRRKTASTDGESASNKLYLTFRVSSATEGVLAAVAT